MASSSAKWCKALSRPLGHQAPCRLRGQAVTALLPLNKHQRPASQETEEERCLFKILGGIKDYRKGKVQEDDSFTDNRQ